MNLKIKDLKNIKKEVTMGMYDIIMGMYDTIYLDKDYLCPICQKKILSIQVKEFENLLESYHVKDCVSHAEDVRIIKDELFCRNCSKHTGKYIYIIVNRGILAGIVDTLEDGKKLLNDLNFEKLVLWYHDQFEKYKKRLSEKNSYRKFLSDLREWYGEKLYENPPTGLEALQFTENSSHLKGTKDPVESIERFLSYDKMKEILNKLWDEGQETLNIYYPEDMSPGEEKWSVDVFQDEINDRGAFNWTWTVINRKELEEENEKEDEMPEWEILVDGPFSDELVKETIDKWLKERGYKFDVRLIPFEEAEGSGTIKELRERLKNKENFVKLEDIDWLKEE